MAAETQLCRCRLPQVDFQMVTLKKAGIRRPVYNFVSSGNGLFSKTPNGRSQDLLQQASTHVKEWQYTVTSAGLRLLSTLLSNL